MAEGPKQQKNNTVRVSDDGIYRGVSVHTPYPLEESDFLKLTKVTSFIPIWAHTFFTGTAVFLITVVAKWLDNKYWNGTNEISNIEWITLIILAVLAVLFEIAYFCWPTEKKTTIEKIDQHFKDNRPRAAGYDL
jgi:hypothetical protein